MPRGIKTINKFDIGDTVRFPIYENGKYVYKKNFIIGLIKGRCYNLVCFYYFIRTKRSKRDVVQFHEVNLQQTKMLLIEKELF